MCTKLQYVSFTYIPSFAQGTVPWNITVKFIGDPRHYTFIVFVLLIVLLLLSKLDLISWLWLVLIRLHFLVTHDIWQNQPYLTGSNWNMDEIFGLKYHLSCVHMPQILFWKSLPAQTKFVIFKHKPSTLWSKSIKLKMACEWRNFKNFFLYHFSSSF